MVPKVELIYKEGQFGHSRIEECECKIEINESLKYKGGQAHITLTC